jgi:hypothetical protein
MEKFTLPGVPGLAVPLEVFTVSHGDPGNTAADQLACDPPDTVTANDPLVFPGALPAVVAYSIPVGAKLIVGLPEMRRDTGTLTAPAVELKVTELRLYPVLSPDGFTLTVTGIAGPAESVVGTPLTLSHGAPAVTDSMARVPPPVF